MLGARRTLSLFQKVEENTRDAASAAVAALLTYGLRAFSLHADECRVYSTEQRPLATWLRGASSEPEPLSGYALNLAFRLRSVCVGVGQAGLRFSKAPHTDNCRAIGVRYSHHRNRKSGMRAIVADSCHAEFDSARRNGDIKMRVEGSRDITLSTHLGALGRVYACLNLDRTARQIPHTLRANSMGPKSSQNQ